ncbi:hypothetical protein [Sphingomonas sp. LaA6.9]|uniref:hypothetical protein n=1 Tax=Sphingomonas sp. LaA6.9 TaxID=2919914 RepID=UPI001F4F6756|nr:hypothetical protein [Sphingomonas sp. LaA6.9]MCJ8157048.1 hypothetical protein [Sphingomonas sp. LaA6.9]
MTGLEQYQHALTRAVCGEMLNGTDRALLGPGMNYAGLGLTARIRQSWCKGRAARAAMLTLSALPSSERAAHLSAWVSAGGGTRAHIQLEAEAFLSFLGGRLADPSDALSLCRLELALVRARRRDDRIPKGRDLAENTMVRRSPYAAIVNVPASIDRIVADPVDRARTQRRGDAEISLLVAPGLAGQLRAATSRERALWRAAETTIRAGVDLETARVLLALGALDRA